METGSPFMSKREAIMKPSKKNAHNSGSKLVILIERVLKLNHFLLKKKHQYKKSAYLAGLAPFDPVDRDADPG